MSIEDKIRELVAERLDKGLGSYGHFRPDDKRDMPREACEEAIDAAIYLSALCLRLGDMDSARSASLWQQRAMRAEADAAREHNALRHMQKQIDELRERAEKAEKEVEELRRYDARELLECPECGGDIRLGTNNHTTEWWYCYAKPQHRGPLAETQLEALLAWHERD